ncbi:carbohydrate sulfotransferase 1-like [Saccostrea echinata]|uniref:carbohydrate sulfotransferase 1-like n=1 Tax=Saccostrea echinata TaxID=191078 RepID=UPI002A81151F|nr:carbohydrate sulfotransferase 1-like [Saccostrea echinata]
MYSRGYVRILQELHTTMRPADQYSTASGPMPAVILTYMRSGSSFFGEMLQASEDVFYLFEPLRTIQFHIRKSNTFRYLDGGSRNYTNFLDLAGDALNEIFQCNFENLPLPFFSDGFLNKGRKSREFKVCLKYKSAINISATTATYQCIMMMKRLCLESKYIILKTIRIPLTVLVPLSETFPNLKILHLLRDPRPTLRSQSRFGIVKSRFLQENATSFCNRVYTDIIIAKHTPTIAPHHYFPVSYENLAKYPFQMARNVYRYLDINLNNKVTSYIENMTMADKTCSESKIAKTMCTKSSNSSADADRWRQKIPFGFVSIVDNACSLLYRVIGLRSIPSEFHLRNLSYSLRGNTIADTGDFRYT